MSTHLYNCVEECPAYLLKPSCAAVQMGIIKRVAMEGGAGGRPPFGGMPYGMVPALSPPAQRAACISDTSNLLFCHADFVTLCLRCWPFYNAAADK